MLCVAVETSTRSPSVAARDADRVVSETLAGDRPHASDLLPALDRLLRQLARRPDAIEVVIVGTGPGSYTGLRVGIASALGLARGSSARLVAVPSGEALAWAELEVGRRATMLLDARAGELYLARYERTQDDVRVLTAPCIVRPEELVLAEGDAIFGEVGIERAARLDAATARRVRTDVQPRATATLELGLLRLQRRGESPAHELEPLYLRAFAAKARKR
jgi:tRNA threonylcarbamoyladenosine biosynthesis protein TsaB